MTDKRCPFFVVIAGNIGVGKTTLTQLLAQHFGWRAYFEKFAENPYLADFYKDMHRWSFHSQVFFLTQRFKSHLEIQQTLVPCVQDRSIYEDAEVFAQNLFERGLMNPRDYQCYRDLYEAMLTSLCYPDLIVYLKASPWTLLSRIRKREREIEKDIDREYLLQLNLAYERWIRRISEHSPIIALDTDQHDLLQDKGWLQKVLNQIDRFYHGK